MEGVAAPIAEAPLPYFEEDAYGVYEKGQLLGMNKDLITFPYKSGIPPLPTPHPDRRIDQNILRERRKVLDSNPSAHDVNAIFEELYDISVDLCTGIPLPPPLTLRLHRQHCHPEAHGEGHGSPQAAVDREGGAPHGCHWVP